MPTGKRRGSIGKADITEGMRAILVDWLVEVQESFELNHETLYTAVKLMDLYLSKVINCGIICSEADFDRNQFVRDVNNIKFNFQM